MEKDLEYREHHIEGEYVKIDGVTLEIDADSPKDKEDAIKQLDEKLHGEKRSA